MIIAEIAGDGIGCSDDKRWPAIEAWAAELGLTAPEAVARVTEISG